MNDFKNDFSDYWNNLPSTKRMSAEKRNAMQNELVGPQGFSTDVLKMMLTYYDQIYVEMHQHPKNKFMQFVRNINNGFISIRVKKPFEFAHCVTVKNGYLLDSIGGKICLWKGEFQYSSWEFISALDCDQATDHQLEKKESKICVEIIDSEDEK